MIHCITLIDERKGKLYKRSIYFSAVDGGEVGWYIDGMSMQENKELAMKELSRVLTETNWQKPLTPEEKNHFNRVRDAEKRSQGRSVNLDH